MGLAESTIPLEMLAAVPDLDVLIGGGGLIFVMAVVAKTLKPGNEIVGVEAAFSFRRRSTSAFSSSSTWLPRSSR